MPKYSNSIINNRSLCLLCFTQILLNSDFALLVSCIRYMTLTMYECCNYFNLRNITFEENKRWVQVYVLLETRVNGDIVIQFECYGQQTSVIYKWS